MRRPRKRAVAARTSGVPAVRLSSRALIGNADVVNAGAWMVLDITNPQGGARIRFPVKTRGLASVVYRRVLSEVMAGIDPKLPPEEMAMAQYRADGESIARGLWVDWADEDENGDRLPFSHDEAMTLLMNPDAVNIHPAAFRAAAIVAQRGLASLEEALKN